MVGASPDGATTYRRMTMEKKSTLENGRTGSSPSAGKATNDCHGRLQVLQEFQANGFFQFKVVLRWLWCIQYKHGSYCRVKLRFGILGELEDDLELEKSISFVPHLRLEFCLTDAEMVGDDEGLSLEELRRTLKWWSKRRNAMGKLLLSLVVVEWLTRWNV
nr:hypothetical protein Iba_chr03aCG2760 [Ipomoea batatas]